MRKSDRKMFANMFGNLMQMVTLLFYTNEKDKENEMRIVVDRMHVLAEEIDVWVEKE